MLVIPEFILKRLYVFGSLRLVPDGIAFDIVNSLGPGILIGVASIRVGPLEFLSEQIQLILGAHTLPATNITEQTPAMFAMHQAGTCLMKGSHNLEVGSLLTLTADLRSREAGKVLITVKDKLKAA